MTRWYPGGGAGCFWVPTVRF